MTPEGQKVALVTGATGQDGSYLVDLLLDKGYKVVGVKRRTSVIATDRIDHVFTDTDSILNFDLVYGNMIDSGNIHRLLQQSVILFNLKKRSKF